jgi:L-iditol 2-dehydrogenase
LRVAVYHNNQDIRLEERPVPEIEPGELLVKVIASGICGSDVLEWYRLRKAPLVLGHEIAGEVVEVGEGVKKYKKGDRVFVSHHVPCDSCHYCLSDHHTACETLHQTNFDPGGFAEYIRVPRLNVEKGVYILPEEVSFEAGTFIEPLGCVWRGQQLAQVRPGSTVLILGSGVSGILHIQLAKVLGAQRIFATDTHPYRLQRAREFGADFAFKADEPVVEKIRQFNEGRLADKIIVCTGAVPAFAQAFKALERGGAILFFAVPEPEAIVPIPLTELWRNEVTLMTSYGAAPADLRAALDLIKNGRIKVEEMISHRLDLSEIALGFKLVAEAKESLKIIIEPNREN